MATPPDAAKPPEQLAIDRAHRIAEAIRQGGDSAAPLAEVVEVLHVQFQFNLRIAEALVALQQQDFAKVNAVTTRALDILTTLNDKTAKVKRA